MLQPPTGIRPGDHHFQQQTQTINQQVPFASFYPFAAVKPVNLALFLVVLTDWLSAYRRTWLRHLR
jgi:hypothetical protein